MLGVAGLGLQLGGGPPGGGEVGQRRVAQLVQGPALPVRVVALAGLFEQVLGAWVGQPAASGGRVDVVPRPGAATGGGGAAVGEEHRSGGATRQQSRQDAVVVYSYFLDVLKRIQAGLLTPAVGPITGSVTSSDRQHMIDDFSRRDGHAVLLSQIEAGGAGLNIQAASIVILAEPQWKPSTEEQAIARAHRMGQVRTVQVHRLLAKGSVDERLREVQEDKRLLFDEYARKSDAKDADTRAVDTTEHRPEVLDDEAVPLKERIIMAEQHRLAWRDRRACQACVACASFG